jgi:transcriptional regulator of acetoin/glycerol metabolism
VGTNAPAVVVKTGQAVTVTGAEHYFACIQSLHCAAAPIRDGRGALAGVLDLTIESRAFGFDAAALVGVYATAIENRLLQASASEHLVLQFQVCHTMLGTPLQALVGVDGHGRVAWLNGTAQQLLGPDSGHENAADTLFGTPLAELLARSAADAARPLRLPNGLTVWLRAQLQARDGVRGGVAVPAAATPLALAPAAAPVPAAEVPAPPVHAATLGQHTREVIERTLHEHGGNISRAARVLGVSRGLLYRRMKGWSAPA